MLKKIAIGTVALLLIIFGLAATKPDTFSVTRVATIKAPPEKIIPLVADFHNWNQWSPWEHLDPKMVRTFDGPASGKGAVYAWKGNGDVGQGCMEVLDQTSDKVRIKLDFIEPFASNNQTEFALTPEGDSTRVTWTMTGPMPMISKVMSVFVSMEKMIAPDFEKGLAQMKATAEK